MERSLRALFAELSGADDPAAVLHAAGFGDVPAPLLADAIAAYAQTAPLAVAEHLAPFAGDAQHGLALLASAPTGPTPVDLGGFGTGHVEDEPAPHVAVPHDHVEDVDPYDHDVSDHHPIDHDAPSLLDHDEHPDPADLLDDDGHHHPL